MKPIKQWLEELPEPYRTQALENYDEASIRFRYNAITKCKHQHKALMNAFNFALSKQGWNYWHDLYKKIQSENLVDKE